MIQVRFDEASRSRLVLVWEEVQPPNPVEVDENAANLLFSIIGRNQDGMKADATPAPRRAATPRRRKPRAAKPKHH